MVFGIRRHLRSESFALSFRRHATPLAVATQALAYGTALCLGTFLLVGGTLSVCSGIYSLRELDHVLRARLSPVRAMGQPPPAASASEELDIENLLGDAEPIAGRPEKSQP